MLSDSNFNRGPYFGRSGPYHHWYQAAKLVQYGMPRDKALETITMIPAKLLRLDHRLGSLEVGKDANIAIFSGGPLDARSWVERVFIEGKEVYERGKDRDLERLLKDPEDYINSCREGLARSAPGLTVEAMVTSGHHIRTYRRLIEEHEVDLLVMNTKDEDQLAMHGLAYSLAIELRAIPLLML